jgi:GrpB-like predicted nucleotidyltransferase (UPF0157 family)
MVDKLQTGVIGEPEQRDILIAEYDSEWPRKFEKHTRMIRGALGGVALSIEHIGSTSVPGLAAKPIIDILVVVPDSSKEETYLHQLEASRYVLRVREPDFHEHRMMRTPEKDVHIHIFSQGSSEIERYLLLRDELRRDLESLEKYEKVKRKLATQSWQDMNAYAKAKTEVIEEIISRARARSK